MAFERFTEKGIRQTKDVSLTKEGQLIFSRRCSNQFGLCRYSYVDLYFDKDETRIGVEGLSEGNTYSLRLRRYSKHGTYAVSLRAFCAFYKIDIAVTRRYDVMDIDNKIVIQL